MEPDVQNVILFAPLSGSTTGALWSWREQFFRSMFIPGVSAFFLTPFQNIAECLVILEARAARLAIKHDDGHAPETLPRNGPIRPLGDHFVHAVFAPCGKPFH